MNARRCLIRFFSFRLFTLPSLGLAAIGSPGTYGTNLYGPGGLKLALFRRGLSLARRFGKRVSVKLLKSLGTANHGVWTPNVPPKTDRSSDFTGTEAAAAKAKDVVVEVEVRGTRALERGRMMDLRAPNPISVCLEKCRVEFQIRMGKKTKLYSEGEEGNWRNLNNGERG